MQGAVDLFGFVSASLPAHLSFHLLPEFGVRVRLNEWSDFSLELWQEMNCRLQFVITFPTPAPTALPPQRVNYQSFRGQTDRDIGPTPTVTEKAANQSFQNFQPSAGRVV